MEKYDYKGCGRCPLSETDGGCRDHRVQLKVKLVKSVWWENWGISIQVFKAGDVIEAEGVAKDGILYCLGGESTLQLGVRDFISLDAIEVVE